MRYRTILAFIIMNINWQTYSNMYHSNSSREQQVLAFGWGFFSVRSVHPSWQNTEHEVTVQRVPSATGRVSARSWGRASWWLKAAAQKYKALAGCGQLCQLREQKPEAREPHNNSETVRDYIRVKPKKWSRTKPQLEIQVFTWTQCQATQAAPKARNESDHDFSVANNRNLLWVMQAKQT